MASATPSGLTSGTLAQKAMVGVATTATRSGFATGAAHRASKVERRAGGMPHCAFKVGRARSICITMAMPALQIEQAMRAMSSKVCCGKVSTMCCASTTGSSSLGSGTASSGRGNLERNTRGLRKKELKYRLLPQPLLIAASRIGSLPPRRWPWAQKWPGESRRFAPWAIIPP
jgi:hypothetical protein